MGRRQGLIMKFLQSLLEMSDDEIYSHKEWAMDWCNDHKEAVQLLQQGKEEEAFHVIANADPQLEDIYIDQLYDHIWDMVE